MAYNYYRKRHYHLSDTKKRQYSQQMRELESYFDSLEDWSISSHLDSVYKLYPTFELRLSNHSADNQYHNLIDAKRITVNVKCSKLDFISIIENKTESIVQFIKTLEIEKYRFINIVDSKANCYLRNYKTKKDVFEF